MAVWSVGIESSKGQQHSSWTQQSGGLTGIPGKDPAYLTCWNQATGCSTSARNPTRTTGYVAGNGCCSKERYFIQLPMLGWDSRQEMGRCAWKCNWSSQDDPDPGGSAGLTAETVSELCREGHLTEAVEALGILVQTDSSISDCLFYDVLKRCVVERNLPLGRRAHAFTVQRGYQSDTFLCNHILRMYAAHGRLEDAMDVFNVVVKPDTFMWSSIILAHVRHAQDKQAIALYHRMRRSDVKPDGHVFVAALQACARGLDLKTGQQVHADVMASDVEPDLFVCSGLVDMYAKCGSLEDAQGVFNGLRQKNVVTWNAMISGYSQQGMGHEALRLYRVMQDEGIVAPDLVTFVCLLQACASVGTLALEEGKQLHAQIRKRGHQGEVFVGSSLVNMYSKCGSLEDAQRVFAGLGRKGVVTWNALLAGYSQQGLGQEALRLYSSMQEEGITVPDAVTFVCLLHACAGAGPSALEKGKQLHVEIRERGHQADVFVANSLVNMYAKCGSLEDAQRMFDGLVQKDVVSWTALIAGYSQQSLGHEALSLYSAMQEDGISVPNSVTFLCLLQACASVGPPALQMGKQLHDQIRQQGHQDDVFVASSLVSMYAKCGSLEDAQKVFGRLSQKNEVTWTSMIAGYAQQGMGQEALRLYSAMQEEAVTVPDSVTFVCLLQVAADVAALHLGRQLHAQIEEHGFQTDGYVARSLINMYGKCGSMVDAQQVFDSLPERDDVAWSALIAGYSCQGDSEVVFDLVQTMREDGIQPLGITFLSLLTVCSHAGLVNKGRDYLEAMSSEYGITPTVEHYTCMVDLLSRAGRLDEALALIRTMPVLPDAAVWQTLLGACRKWSNVEVGRHAFDQVVKLDTKDSSAYVLMSNIYTSAQMWEQSQSMQVRRIRHEAWKQPGQSWWTDIAGVVHSFLVGGEKHFKSRSSLRESFIKHKKRGHSTTFGVVTGSHSCS